MYFMNFLRTPISENGCFYIYAKYEVTAENSKTKRTWYEAQIFIEDLED